MTTRTMVTSMGPWNSKWASGKNSGLHKGSTLDNLKHNHKNLLTNVPYKISGMAPFSFFLFRVRRGVWKFQS